MNPLRWLFSRRKSGQGRRKPIPDARERMSRCKLIKLEYKGPSAVKDHLTREIRDAGFHLATSEVLEEDPLVLEFHCKLGPTASCGAYHQAKLTPLPNKRVQGESYKIETDSTEDPVAYPYTIVAKVGLFYRGVWSNLLQETITGQHPDYCQVQGSVDQLLQDYAIGSLKHEIDRLVRASIPEAIGAVERLICALEHPNSYVRARAADALGRTRDKRAIEPLVKHLSDKDFGYIWGARKKLPPPYIHRSSLYSYALPSPTYSAFGVGISVRKACAEALKTLKIAVGWQPKNGAERVRFLAANGSFADVCMDPSATDVLIELLWDGDFEHELNATRSLGELRSIRAVSGLIRKLDEVWQTATNPMDERYIKEQHHMQFYEEAIRGPFGDLFKAAAVDKAKQKPSTILLIELAITLGKIGDTCAVEPLITTLKHEDNNMRVVVAEALKNITGQHLGPDYDSWLNWWEGQKK